jgi:hypothetical protein
VQPPHTRDEEHRGERGDVDQRRAQVGLQEHEQHRGHAERDRGRDRRQPTEFALTLDQEPGDREDEQHLPELGRLELDRPDVDPPLRAAHGLREDEDEDHQADRAEVDRPPATAVERGRDHRCDHEPGAPDGGGNGLTHDEVVRFARDVEPRDAGHRPQPVADERARGEEQHDVEPSDEGGEVDRVAAERDPLASGVDDHQSVFTSVCEPPLTPKNFSNTRSAAGAAAVEPCPPFSITAQTTMRATSVCAGP